MLAAGSTQAATAEALAVSDRTIRNWAKGKAFQRALAHAQTRAQQQHARAQQTAARPHATHELQNAAGRREPVQHSDQAQPLDEQDARQPLSRADLPEWSSICKHLGLTEERAWLSHLLLPGSAIEAISG
jgi:hypothetical protein